MKRTALVLAILLSWAFVSAQSFTQRISAKAVKEKTFTAADIIGELGDNLLVANVSPGDFSPEGAGQYNYRLQLALYDKKTFNPVKVVPLKWVGMKNIRPNLRFANSKNVFIMDNQVYVLWMTITGKKSSLLVQILDANLKEVKAPATCYEFPQEYFVFNGANLFGLVGPDHKTLIIGGEESASRKENVKLQYKVFDEKMNVLQSVQVELPFYKKKRNSGAAANYVADNNGDLYYATPIVNKSKDQVFMIGKVKAENSTTSEFYLPANKITFLDLELVNQGNFLKGFAITTKGLATFTIDKPTFTLQGDVIMNNLEYAKVKFSDFSPLFNKSSIEEKTIKKILNENLTISNSRELPGGRYILTLNNLFYYEVCNRGGCTPFTRMDGQHYAMIAADGTLEWISCTKQKFNKRSFYRPDDDVAVVNNTMVSGVIGGTALHVVDLKTGKITIKPVKSNYKYRIIDIENDHIYFTDYKSKKSPLTYGLTAGVLGASIGIAALTGQYYIIAGGVVAGLGVYGLSRTRSDLYLGEILINK